MISFDFTSACSNQEVVKDLVSQIMMKLGITNYVFQANENPLLFSSEGTPCTYLFKLPDFYLTSEVFSALITVLVRLPFVALVWLILHLFYFLIPEGR